MKAYQPIVPRVRRARPFLQQWIDLGGPIIAHPVAARRRLSGMLVVVLAGLTGGCGSTGPECVTVGNYSVIVTLSDAQTGERPETGVMIILSDGEIADTASYPASVGNPLELVVGFERTGTFSVSVTAAGYVPWMKDNVVVPRNDCGGAVTQRFDVRLQPLPG